MRARRAQQRCGCAPGGSTALVPKRRRSPAHAAACTRRVAATKWRGGGRAVRGARAWIETDTCKSELSARQEESGWARRSEAATRLSAAEDHEAAALSEEAQRLPGGRGQSGASLIVGEVRNDDGCGFLPDDLRGQSRVPDPINSPVPLPRPAALDVIRVEVHTTHGQVC